MTGYVWRQRAPNVAWLLLVPLLALVALAYALPLLGVARWSVTLPTPGLGQYGHLLSDPLTREVFARTLRICGIVTLAAVGAAYAIAYVWVRGAGAQRHVVEFCILVPFWVSVLTRAFGWVALLSSHGLLNTWLLAAGLIHAPLTLVRNELGVVLGMTHFLIPFAVFPIAASMRALDERVLLAARGLGAGALRVFWTVFLPMTRAGVLGAALVVFVFSLGFFVTPAILGGGRSVMVAELVYLRVFQSPDWGFAAALSVVLVAVVAALVAGLYRFTRLDTLAG
jgi:putative spermidine/putrescine transport system permease protein